MVSNVLWAYASMEVILPEIFTAGACVCDIMFNIPFYIIIFKVRSVLGHLVAMWLLRGCSVAAICHSCAGLLIDTQIALRWHVTHACHVTVWHLLQSVLFEVRRALACLLPTHHNAMCAHTPHNRYVYDTVRTHLTTAVPNDSHHAALARCKHTCSQATQTLDGLDGLDGLD